MVTLNSLVSWDRKFKGYTLVEIIVATSILIILSGIMLGYSSSSRKSIELANNEATLLGLLFNAKAISQSFVLDPPDPSYQICAYGVHVDYTAGAQRAFIFRDLVLITVSCDTSDNVYTASNSLEILPGDLNTFTISNILEFGDDPVIPDLVDVVFIPPDPTTKINYLPPPDAVVEEAAIIIQSKEDPDINFRVLINLAGQISIE